ncbi:synaptotagmin 45 [Helobdella robusta]|uniref:Synaptotagmin 45 n=1 Tax=Helobdella robusta TaxID=6412 RepID=T1FYC7_HELRO|nr:synaptotagmin 45 [Helobdella robusta]ESO02062.1 synaptotagmin 45 [Helobdella robusta]
MQPGLDDLPEKQFGTLHYSLDYNLTKNILHVGVIRIDDLPGSIFSKPSSTFVRVRIHPELRTFETKVVNLTRNPVFQEIFSFTMPPSKQASSTVVFSVYDYQMFTKHKLLSQLHLPLKTLILADLVEDFALLEEPSKLEEEQIGDICLSLKFVPAQNKLHVIVIEAKNLHKWSSELKDPYVKLYLMMNKKLLKKRKTTTIVATDINPYFNEAFEFNVSLEDIKNCSLLVRVSYKRSLGRSNHIGEVLLGLEKLGTGYKHWTDIVATPGQPFAMWHNLNICEN